MKPPFPYPPLSVDTLTALALIEHATTLKTLNLAFATVQAEALRRAGVSCLIAVLLTFPLLATIIAAQRFGWFGVTEVWPYAFVPMATWVLAPLAEFLLRGPKPKDDERRLRDALNVWKVLQRKETTRDTA